MFVKLNKYSLSRGLNEHFKGLTNILSNFHEKCSQFSRFLKKKIIFSAAAGACNISHMIVSIVSRFGHKNAESLPNLDKYIC